MVPRKGPVRDTGGLSWARAHFLDAIPALGLHPIVQELEQTYVARTGTCAPSPVPAPLCARADRQPEAWRRLCSRDARGDRRGAGRISRATSIRGWGSTRPSRRSGRRPMSRPVSMAGRTQPRPEAIAQARLARITPRSRQAFLLTALEGFTPRGRGLSDRRRAGRGRDAGRRGARRDRAADATDVLIIEDEPIIAVDIEALVRELGHDVTGVAVTRDEAVSAGDGAAGRAWCSPTSSWPTTVRASTR